MSVIHTYVVVKSKLSHASSGDVNENKCYLRNALHFRVFFPVTDKISRDTGPDRRRLFTKRNTRQSMFRLWRIEFYQQCRHKYTRSTKHEQSQSSQDFKRDRCYGVRPAVSRTRKCSVTSCSTTFVRWCHEQFG